MKLRDLTSPLPAFSAASSRMKVDLPEPDGPIRKTNSPLSILTLMSSNAGRADDLYCLVTWSRVIISRTPGAVRLAGRRNQRVGGSDLVGVCRRTARGCGSGAGGVSRAPGRTWRRQLNGGGTAESVGFGRLTRRC